MSANTEDSWALGAFLFDFFSVCIVKVKSEKYTHAEAIHVRASVEKQPKHYSPSRVGVLEAERKKQCRIDLV